VRAVLVSATVQLFGRIHAWPLTITTQPTRPNPFAPGYLPTRAFQFLFTPTYSSPMFQVGRWFSAFTAEYLQRSVQTSVTELDRGITKWARAWNEKPKPFIWIKSADEVFASMQKYLDLLFLNTLLTRGTGQFSYRGEWRTTTTGHVA
jgi:hypothetical protein